MGANGEELAFLSAREMAEKVRSREISPIELVESHLERINRLNPRLNAFVVLDAEGARRQAKNAEKAAMQKQPLGQLHGVPITIKSSVAVAGWRCESGTRLRAGTTPTADAALVARLRAAGAILLGNTNTPELLMAYETDNLLIGRTNNPWDLRRTPGGSSGGEAAAIAACCSTAGVGSDGGGSIRVPAHFTGICGLKPTPGRIPASGHFPPSTGPFALLGVVGPMARTVGDLQILFEVMAGYDHADPLSAPVPVRRPSEKEMRSPRVGYFIDDGHTPVTNETRQAIEKAASALAQQGFQVEPFRPEGLESARRYWWTLFGRVGELLLGPMLEGHEAELSPILSEFTAMVRTEPQLTLEEFVGALIARDELRAQFLGQMESYPIVLCPVSSIPAFRHGERQWRVDGEVVQYLDAMSYSQWFNLLGNPAAAIPVGRSPEGLPIGVQVVGQPYGEELILAIAAKIEEACGGYCRPPI